MDAALPATPAADAPLTAILDHLQAALAAGAPEVTILALDPDHGAGCYAGEPLTVDGVAGRHRPWRVWVELADRLELRLGTPRPAAGPLIAVRFSRRAPTPALPRDPRERYGATSDFARASKLEEPGFVLDFADAVARAGLTADARVLVLGVNRGDELALLQRAVPGLSGSRMTGIDHSPSALAIARARFPDATLLEADLAHLDRLGLGAFDLIVAIATLQSPGIDDRAVLRALTQHHLADDAAIILGIPNGRYRDGELSHGARMKNFAQPELGLVVKDLAFYRKYLQQHRMQVYVTGHHELLVTGVRRARPEP
ncbi:MAG: methyltransferase domain-containing protein [Deltaproteobacteria bacterium]|nr:methyltransferase domain-containing protein [Deltaproteobacteria bacterium]